MIEDSASSATLCALLAARQRAQDAGADLGDLVAYATAHTHSSLEKAARVAGLRPDQVRVVAVDDTFAMAPEALAVAIGEDRAAGRTPFFCCATVGTTSSLAVDPVPALAEVVADTGVWLHVDGAMAGSAAVCPELRWVNDGLDRADSYAFNPHKWLFTNFDCTCFWVADRAALLAALSILPEYLRNEASASGAVIDYRDWQVPLGRRFRALKLWFVIRHYGAEGLAHHVRRHVALADELVGWVEADDRFALAAPPRLGPGLPAPRRRRRRHPGPARRRQRLRGAVPDPHPSRRPPRHPGLDRPDPHRGTSRPGPLGSPHVPGRRPSVNP